MRHYAAAFSLISMLGVAVGFTPLARAQTPASVEAARDQFRDGVALMTAGDFANALTKFKLVARVKMNAQVAFNIADCEDHLGNLVSALGNYRLAAQKAQDGTAPQVAQVVDARIDALDKRIPHLTLVRVEKVRNARATIQLDGADLAASQIGKDLRVDPGERVATVLVGNKVVATARISLAEGETKSLDVLVPAPVAASSDGEGAPAVVSQSPSIPGIVLTSAGGVSLVLGLVFIGVRQSAIADLNKECSTSNVCPSSAKPTADRGKLMTGLSEVTIPVGVVALTTGIVLIATHKKAEGKSSGSLLHWGSENRSVSSDFVLGAPSANGPGLSLTGQF